MALLVAGTFRVPPNAIEALAPHMAAVVVASLGEEGCEAYSYAADLNEAGLIHVFERWRDAASLDAHFQTPHMAAWRAARDAHGFRERRIQAFEVSSERES